MKKLTNIITGCVISSVLMSTPAVAEYQDNWNGNTKSTWESIVDGTIEVSKNIWDEVKNEYQEQVIEKNIAKRLHNNLNITIDDKDISNLLSGYKPSMHILVKGISNDLTSANVDVTFTYSEYDVDIKRNYVLGISDLDVASVTYNGQTSHSVNDKEISLKQFKDIVLIKNEINEKYSLENKNYNNKNTGFKIEHDVIFQLYDGISFINGGLEDYFSIKDFERRNYFKEIDDESIVVVSSVKKNIFNEVVGRTRRIEKYSNGFFGWEYDGTMFEQKLDFETMKWNVDKKFDYDNLANEISKVMNDKSKTGEVVKYLNNMWY